jgi:hypothetical protein
MAGDPFTAAIFRWLRAIAADPAQPPAAFECAFVISQRVNRISKKAWPSQEVVAEDMGLCGKEDARHRQVRRSLKYLVDGGYLLPQRRKHSSTVYQLAQDRTPLSFQNEETVNDREGDLRSETETREDNYVLSSDHERTSASARTDADVRKNGRSRPTNHLNNHLRNQEGERRAHTTLPDNWRLSDEDHDFALGEGVADIEGMAGVFADYYRGNGEVKANWSATWRTWVRRERKFNPTGADQILSKLRKSEAPTPAVSDGAWDQIIALFAKTGHWTRHVDVCGNAPPAPDCRAPKHILAKYGLAEAAA